MPGKKKKTAAERVMGKAKARRKKVNRAAAAGGIGGGKPRGTNVKGVAGILLPVFRKLRGVP